LRSRTHLPPCRTDVRQRYRAPTTLTVRSRQDAYVRAQVLEQPAPAATGPLRAVDRERPAPGPGEVLVEVSACAVCRTDLQLCEGDLEARRLPIVPGHQIVGRISEVGEGVPRE